MSILIDVVAAVTMLAGVALIAAGSFWLGSGLFFDIRWNWARGVEIKRSVRLGWNVGMPPEDRWVLVRNNLPKRGALSERIGDCDTGRWAVMKRKGEVLWSQTGGYGMPVKNVSGWLEIVGGDE